MNKEGRLSELYKLNQMPNTSPFTAAFNLLLIGVFHLHQFSFFYGSMRMLYPNMQNFFSNYTVNVSLNSDLAPVCYSIVAILTSLILLVVLYNEDKFEGFRYILAWMGSRIFPVLRILIELNVVLPAYFMMVDLYSGIIFFVAVFINLFVTFFMQNYNIRKDYLCCKDVEYMMMFKVLLFIGYGVNAVAVTYCSSTMFISALVIHLCISVSLFLGYFFKGIIIYRHAISRNIFIGLLVLYMSLAAGQLCDEICRQIGQYQDTQLDLIYGGMFCVLLGGLSWSLFEWIRQYSLEENKPIKNKIYFIGDKMSNFSVDIENECQMRGLIKLHIDSCCTNPDCFTTSQTVYDSKKSKFCSLSKINQNKSTFLKLYIKCLHQRHLQTHTSVTDKIDYTEFYYYKLKNTYKALHLLYQCDTKFQFPHDRIRVTRLKKAIIAENKRLNKELYEGNLDIEFIIECEKRFEQLKTLLFEVLKKNLAFWEYVHRNKIDLTELIEIVRPNFSTIETINDGWKDLAKYFEVQKKWKFYYAWYLLYVKNQKLKPVIIQYFGTEVHEDQLFSLDAKDMDKASQKLELRSTKIIFQSNAAVVHTNSNADRPEIKRVNNYFTKLFGYTQTEVIDASINVLMPKSVSNFHKDLFEDWVVSGKSNSEPNFPIRKIYARHKSGHLFGMYKYLKQLVNIDSSLQYVAMFKTPKEDEAMLIMDDCYTVQGMSCFLYNKLGFDKIAVDQTTFPTVNFNLICPKFLKHSTFGELVTSDDEVFFGIDRQKKKDKEKQRNPTLDLADKTRDKEKQNPIPTQIEVQRATDNKLKTDKVKLEEDVEHLKLSLRIPDNITELLQVYASETINVNEKAQLYRTLKKAFLFSKNCKNFSRFNCEVDINTRKFNKVTFYEVFFRQMYSLDNRNQETIVVEKKRKKDISFVPEDFHKFFESSQDNRSYSLAFSNNIFIKEDNNRPVQRLSHIDGLTFFMRIFFLVFLAIILVAYLFNSYVNFVDFEKNSQRLFEMTRFDMNLPYLQNKLYDKYFINNGDLASITNADYNTKVTGIISDTFNKLQQLKNSPSLKKAIFDPNINTKQLYQSNLVSGATQYDQIDIIYKSIQAAESIMHKPLDAYTLSAPGSTFFQQYLTPSMSELTEGCSVNLVDTFTSSLANIEKITIIMYVIEGLALGLGLLLAINNTRKITYSFIAIMEVFTQFSQGDIVKIYKYCHFLAKIFKHLNEKDVELRYPEKALMTKRSTDEDRLMVSNLSFNGNYYDNENNNNININKKIKKIQVGSVLNKLRAKTFIYFVLFLSIFAGSSFYLNFFIKSNGETINNLALQGRYAFKTFSLLTKVQLALKKRYENKTDFDNRLKPLMMPDINNLILMKNISALIATGQNFDFLTHYNNMFFSDVCAIYSDALVNKTDVDTCRTVAQNSLQHGIQSYIYYYTSISIDYLTDNHLDVRITDIYNLESGLVYVNIFLELLAKNWLDEFSRIVLEAQHKLTIYAVCVLSGYLLLYLILIEILIIGNLNKNYDFFRRVYEMYMPDFLVSKEKIIKAKLIVDGILNK